MNKKKKNPSDNKDEGGDKEEDSGAESEEIEIDLCEKVNENAASEVVITEVATITEKI